MVVQKLKLSEWFLIYQLEKIKEKSCHIPFTMKVDLTRLHEHFSKQNKKFPINSLLLIGLGIWAEENPEAHKMLFKSFMGMRFLKGDEVRINFPILLREGKQKITSAVVIKNPQKKTWNQLQEEIKSKLVAGLKSYPITWYVHSNRNNFLNRTLLKCLYIMISRSPGFYWKRGGGCISLSSLSHLSTNPPVVYPLGFGPTGFTFCFNSLDFDSGKVYLQMGVGVDHSCYEGHDMMVLLQKLAAILEAKDETYFERLTRSV